MADEAAHYPSPATERTPLLAQDAPPDPSPPPPTSPLSLPLTLSGVYLSAFTAALDATLVATLSGPISSSFDATPLLGWVGSAFFVAATATQPLAGRLSDVYGRRAALVCANVVFALGNVACAGARSGAGLLAGRVLAGLGGGAIQPLASVVMTDLVSLRGRGVWQGVANVCFGVGSGIGGPVGGWVAGAVGWRWAFAGQVPVSVVAVGLVVWRVPGGLPCRPGRAAGGEGWLEGVDVLGGGLLSTGLVLVLLGLLAGGNQLAWTHPLVLTKLPLGVVVLAAFAYVEACVAAEPILPVRLLRVRTVAAGCLANWFHPMARFGLLFHLPLYLQVQGLRPALGRAVGTGPEAAELAHRLERNLSLLADPEPGLKEMVQEAYMHALRAAFLVLLGLGVLGAISGALVKQHKLHSKLSRKPSEEVVGDAATRQEEQR